MNLGSESGSTPRDICPDMLRCRWYFPLFRSAYHLEGRDRRGLRGRKNEKVRGKISSEDGSFMSEGIEEVT